MMTEPPKARILVVDDDVDTCENLHDILSDLGYEVDMAHDGPSAIELVRQCPYDVALLDFKMPGMDGLTLYRAIKEIRAGTVAVIVTAYASGNTAEVARAAGAWQVLPKPVDFPKLLGLVHTALEQPLVMVVDDDHQLCENLWDLLRDRGYRVCLANDELQAAERVKERSYRAVLIDLKLSETGSGARVFEVVRQANPDAHVILITGFRSEMNDLVQKLVDEGADAVCYKPFDLPAMLDTLKHLAHQSCEVRGS